MTLTPEERQAIVEDQQRINLEMIEKGARENPIRYREGWTLDQMRRHPEGRPVKRRQQVVVMDEHIAIARTVHETVGTESLMFNSGSFWRWRETGIWKPIKDREVQQEIHAVLDAGDFAVKFGKSTVDSVLDLMRTECFKAEHRWNAGDGGINTLTGILRWDSQARTWAVTPHRREDYFITQIPVAYDPKAQAPRFLTFLQEIFDSDKDALKKAQCLLEFMGYTLIPDCRYERFMLLVGPTGANGKTVTLKVMESLLGPDMVCAVQPSQLDNKFQRAHLAGKLANIVTEIAEGAEIADAQLKAMVSGELTTAEHKHRPPFDFHPVAAHWFATNHMPHSRDFSDALFRRALILTFNNRFTGAQCDPQLVDKLKAEIPGILNLCLEGLGIVFQRGYFTEPDSSLTAKHEWRLQCDQAAQYCEERLDLKAGARVGTSALYSDYRNWAHEQGVVRVLSQKSLVERLKTRHGLEGSRDNSVRYLHGCQLRGSMGYVSDDDRVVPFRGGQ